MKLIVTDANILIHLSRLDLVDNFIGMDFEVHTTDFIIDEYYKGIGKDKKLKNLDRYIRAGKILIHEYNLDELLVIYKQRKGLSPSDCSVFKLSHDLNAILLTSDKTLKLFSEQSNLTVYGIIWLIDEMKKKGILDIIEYREKLTELKTLSQRLPIDEIDRRLK